VSGEKMKNGNGDKKDTEEYGMKYECGVRPQEKELLPQGAHAEQIPARCL
jgi:hypothetical protein